MHRVFLSAVAASWLIASASAAPVAIQISTDVLLEGNAAGVGLADGSSNSSGLELIRYVNYSASSPYAVAYNTLGATIDVSSYLVGGTFRGAGQHLKVNGYSINNGADASGNLFLRGQSNVNNPGFGAHANWIVTIDLDVVRAQQFGGDAGPLTLTGQFGAWGGIGSTDAAAGVVQGTIYLDGQRIDSMPTSVANPSGAVLNPQFNLGINSGRWLTFGVFSGTEATTWDDAVFQNVQLISGLTGAPVSRPGLLAYYNFDEDGGNVAYDRAGANHGTILGTVQRTAGAIGGGALQFNNDNSDGVNVGNHLKASTGITIEALVKLDEDFVSGNRHIFRKEDGGNRLLFSFQSGNILSLGLNTDGYSELDVVLNGLGDAPTLASLIDGEFHHLVARYDSITGEKSLWIDGVKIGVQQITPGTLITSGGAVNAIIGRSHSTEPFWGDIDEFAFWDRALTDQEIRFHFQNFQAGYNYFAPEPSSWAMLGLGLAGCALLVRRRRRRA